MPNVPIEGGIADGRRRVQVFSARNPLASDGGVVEVEVDVKFGSDIVGVGNRALQARQILWIDRPGHAFSGGVKRTGGGETCCYEVLEMKGPKVHREA